MTPDLSDKNKLLKEVAARSNLREGPQGIESVLRAIFRAQHEAQSEPLTGRALARIVRMPVPVVTAVRRELESAGVVEPGPHVRLTDQADEVLSGQWGWAASPPAEGGGVCETCEGS